MPVFLVLTQEFWSLARSAARSVRKHVSTRNDAREQKTSA